MESDPTESFPAKSTIEELDGLRDEFRSALQAYASRIEGEIGLVKEAVSGLSTQKKVPSAKLHDLRDMLTLLRKFSIKPEKGRRKDLKKIDALVGDLTMLIEHWKPRE
jgi:hypothetical protein